MTDPAPPRETALIVGAGDGLSASLARLLSRDGMQIALAARRPDKLTTLCQETGARAYPCDASEPAQVDALFAAVTRDGAAPELVIYNPSYRTRGPLVELDRDEVRKTLMVTCYGAFLVAQLAARAMLARGRGSLFFTGASAGVKGFAKSAPFAMGKFGLRGLTQSLARELGPQNIHVAHFVIDGGIKRANDSRADRGPDGMLEPDAIAATYLSIHRQHRSAWSAEIELRPWVEKF